MPTTNISLFFPGSGFSGSVFLATSKRQPKSRFAVKSIKLYSHLELQWVGGNLKKTHPTVPTVLGNTFFGVENGWRVFSLWCHVFTTQGWKGYGWFQTPKAVSLGLGGTFFFLKKWLNGQNALLSGWNSLEDFLPNQGKGESKQQIFDQADFGSSDSGLMEIARADVFFLIGWDSPCDQNSGL